MYTKARKLWTKPKDLPVIVASKYERSETSRPYWKSVLAILEMAVKDDKFFESQQEALKEALPELIYNRLTKLYHFGADAKEYQMKSEASTANTSGFYYKYHVDHVYSEEAKPLSHYTHKRRKKASRSNLGSSLSLRSNKTESGGGSSHLLFKTHSRISRMSWGVRSKKSSFTEQLLQQQEESSTETSTKDDLIVNIGDDAKSERSWRRQRNPHFDLMKTGKPLRDIITWNSKLKPSQFQISESDAFEIQVEMLSKKIAEEFFNWYVSVGSADFVSEIKKPEDIETLFQVWFDEHASKSIILCPKILPCVLDHIARACGVPRLGCTATVQREVTWDIKAERDPKKITAFGSALPQNLKHIPPDNNTAGLWRALRIPEDLKTMACVFDGIQHLTSAKEFHRWLKRRPYLPMPEFFASLDRASGKKPLFAIPSDFILPSGDDDDDDEKDTDLALPQSTVDLKMSRILKDLMD